MNSVYDGNDLHLVNGNQIAGKRLRVDGIKRSDEEARQQRRLAEMENKELKESLKYVEI